MIPYCHCEWKGQQATILAPATVPGTVRFVQSRHGSFPLEVCSRINNNYQVGTLRKCIVQRCKEMNQFIVNITLTENLVMGLACWEEILFSPQVMGRPRSYEWQRSNLERWGSRFPGDVVTVRIPAGGMCKCTRITLLLGSVKGVREMNARTHRGKGS